MKRKQGILMAVGIVALLVLLLAPANNEALGATPSLEGAWVWTHWVDPDAVQGATQTLCFYNDGTWNSPTFVFSGVWKQEKNKFKMCGDYSSGTSAYSTSGTVSKKKLAKTVFQDWHIHAGSGFWFTGAVTAVRTDPVAAGCAGPGVQAEFAAPTPEGISVSIAR